MKVKEILQKILNERDELSVSGLARKSGVPKANIQSWLTGSSPNIEQLDKVARTLGVSFEYLAFGRSEHEKAESLLDKVLVHTGTYEISVRKVVKKYNKEEE